MQWNAALQPEQLRAAGASIANVAQRTFQDYTECLVTREDQRDQLVKLQAQRQSLEERTMQLQADLDECRMQLRQLQQPPPMPMMLVEAPGAAQG